MCLLGKVSWRVSYTMLEKIFIAPVELATTPGLNVKEEGCL
jgi:hypothetical protein